MIGFLTYTVAFAAAAALLGAAIDFWLGKAGQRRVRKWLEHKWLLVSDVHLSNFGRREAAFAAQVIESVFDRFVSRRRIMVVVVLFIVGCLFSAIVVAETQVLVSLADYDPVWIFGSIAVSAVLFSVTVSITLLIAKTTERYVPERTFYSFTYFALLFGTQYMVALIADRIMECVLVVISVFATWRVAVNPFDPVQQSVNSIDDIVRTMFEKWTWWPYSHTTLSYGLDLDGYLATNVYADLLSMFANGSRLLLACVFLLSFALRPLQSFVMTLWARIIESELPVFTLVFGGIAGLAKCVLELVKAFAG